MNKIIAFKTLKNNCKHMSIGLSGVGKVDLHWCDKVDHVCKEKNCRIWKRLKEEERDREERGE